MANNTMGNTNNNRQGGRGNQGNQNQGSQGNQDTRREARGGNQGTAGTQRQAGRNDMDMDSNTRSTQGRSDSDRSDR